VSPQSAAGPITEVIVGPERKGGTRPGAGVLGVHPMLQPRLDPSCGEDVVPMPIEILAGGGLGAGWQEQRLLQGRAPVILPGE